MENPLRNGNVQRTDRITSVFQVCSENRETLLQLIIRENFEDAALFLLEYIPSDVVNVNHMNTYGETAMHLAIIYGHTRLVSRLLKSGANVNIETVSLNGKDFRKFERYSGYVV